MITGIDLATGIGSGLGTCLGSAYIQDHIKGSCHAAAFQKIISFTFHDSYGWVQDDLMPSRGFESPQLFSWVDQMKASEKYVSITSMECIHAVQGMPKVSPAPTTFFYKRCIQNQDEIGISLVYRIVYCMSL